MSVEHFLEGPACGRSPLQVIMILFLCLLAITSMCEGVNLAYMPCNSTIPIDSQFIFDPVWSITPHRDAIKRASGVDLVVGRGSVSQSVYNVIKSESGMDPRVVTLFYLNPNAGGASPLTSSSDSTSSTGNTGTSCTIYLDPLQAGLAGTRATALRLVFVGVEDAGPDAACGMAINATVRIGGQSADATLRTTAAAPLAFAQSLTFGAGRSDAVAWPGAITFPAGCQLSVLVLTDRHGRIDTWYTWIPTTIYTAVVTALILPAMLTTGHMPMSIIVLEIVFVFLGYLGSCIGLMVELISWQSSLGRMFPFPSSVTLYTCMCVLYALYLLPLVYRQGHYRIMLMGVLRLLVYGLNVGLCVGYWIGGYVLLGSLALAQYVVTNFILTLYFARVTVRLRDVSRHEGAVKLAHVFMYMWFIPATPFAVCGLLYSDLYVITQFGAVKKPGEARMRDLVYAYNAQMSVPLLLFQNIYGIALVAAATAFHMPFVIPLFMAVWLFGLHFIYTIDVYTGAYRHWRGRGVAGLDSFTGCGWLSLSSIMDHILQRANAARGGDGRLGGAPAPEWGWARGGPSPSLAGSVDRLSSPGGRGYRRRHSAVARQQSPIWTPLPPHNEGHAQLGSATYGGDSGAISFPPLPSLAHSTTTPVREGFVPDPTWRQYDVGGEELAQEAMMRAGGAAGGYPGARDGLPLEEGEGAESPFWPTDVER